MGAPIRALATLGAQSWSRAEAITRDSQVGRWGNACPGGPCSYQAPHQTPRTHNTQHTTRLPQKASLLLPPTLSPGGLVKDGKGDSSGVPAASTLRTHREPRLQGPRFPAGHHGSVLAGPRPGSKPRDPQALWISSGPGEPGRDCSPQGHGHPPGDSEQGLHPRGTLPGRRLRETGCSRGARCTVPWSGWR